MRKRAGEVLFCFDMCRKSAGTATAISDHDIFASFLEVGFGPFGHSPPPHGRNLKQYEDHPTKGLYIQEGTVGLA